MSESFCNKLKDLPGVEKPVGITETILNLTRSGEKRCESTFPLSILYYLSGIENLTARCLDFDLCVQANLRQEIDKRGGLNNNTVSGLISDLTIELLTQISDYIICVLPQRNHDNLVTNSSSVYWEVFDAIRFINDNRKMKQLFNYPPDDDSSLFLTGVHSFEGDVSIDDSYACNISLSQTTLITGALNNPQTENNRIYNN